MRKCSLIVGISWQYASGPKGEAGGVKSCARIGRARSLYSMPAKDASFRDTTKKCRIQGQCRLREDIAGSFLSSKITASIGKETASDEHKRLSSGVLISPHEAQHEKYGCCLISALRRNMDMGRSRDMKNTLQGERKEIKLGGVHDRIAPNERELRQGNEKKI